MSGINNIKYLAYAFDWDDNILYMPTSIIVINDKNEEVNMSTNDFAKYRNLIGKKKFKYKGHIITGYPKDEKGNIDFDSAYRNFRDFSKENIFLKDTIKAIKEKKFGPSWDDFIECLTGGSIFAIITARGHLEHTIREAIEWIIDNFLSESQKSEMHSNLLKFAYLFKEGEDFERIYKGKLSQNKLTEIYLNNCEYIGISSPKRGGVPDNPEKEKEIALLEFKKKVNDFAKKIGTKAKLGFSDDDIENINHITKVIKDINNEDYSWIKEIVIKKTHGGKIDKYVKTMENVLTFYKWKKYLK